MVKKLQNGIAFIQRYPAPFVFLLLSFLGLLIYSNSFQGSFQFDDARWIEKDPFIRDVSNLGAIREHVPRRFLWFLSLAVNYHFHHVDVLGYHIVNFLIHLFCSVFVYFFVRITFQTPRLRNSPLSTSQNTIALFASLLFLSHPIQTQAVTYIIQRATSLATLFYILSMLAYAKSRLSKRHSIPFLLLAIITALAAMFTKEIALTLPLNLLLYEVIFFPSSQESVKRRVLRILPFLLMLPIIPYLFLMQHAIGQEWIAAVTETKSITRMDYFFTQINVVRTYIRLLFIPVKQALDYEYPISHGFFEMRTILSFAFLAAIVGLGVKLLKTKPVVSFGIFWIFLTLSIESSFIPIRDVIYEHRLYLPMVGFVMAICSGLRLLIRKTLVYVLLFSMVVSIFSVLTYQRNWVWKDRVSLWLDSVRKFPEGVRARHNLANAYYGVGNYDEAIEHAKKAISLNPSLPEPYNTLGAIYADQKKFKESIQYFQKSISVDPTSADAYYNLAVGYYETDQRDKWKKYIDKAFLLNPEMVELLVHLGYHYAEKCDIGKAIEYFQKGLRLRPDHAMAEAVQRSLDRIMPKAGELLEDKIKDCEDMAFFISLRDLTKITSQVKHIKNMRGITRLHKIYKTR